ncbi:hypothetical protein [Providencia stuartii]
MQLNCLFLHDEYLNRFYVACAGMEFPLKSGNKLEVAKCDLWLLIELNGKQMEITPIFDDLKSTVLNWFVDN